MKRSNETYLHVTNAWKVKEVGDHIGRAISGRYRRRYTRVSESQCWFRIKFWGVRNCPRASKHDANTILRGFGLAQKGVQAVYEDYPGTSYRESIIIKIPFDVISDLNW